MSKKKKQQEAEQPPPPTQGAKVIRILASVGNEDERTLEAFLEDAKETLRAAGAKNVTSLGGYYLVDGQPVRPNGSNFLSGEADPTTDHGPQPEAQADPPKPKTAKPPQPQQPQQKPQANKPQANKKVSMRKKED